MLKRCMVAVALMVVLALPARLQQPVHAETCIMSVVCNVTPTESSCVHMKVCFGGG